MADFECRDLDKDCPYRIIDISKNIAICNFYKIYWKTYNNNPIDASNLTKKACDGIRQYELYQEFLSETSAKRTLKMLKNVKIGDALFWLPRSEDVILIENPSKLSTITKCICQRYNKEIVKIYASFLIQISKGSYYQDYYIYGADKTREVRILELTARKAGFRVESKTQENGFKLRFYGDSQEEVDDVVNLTVRNDFVLL